MQSAGRHLPLVRDIPLPAQRCDCKPGAMLHHRVFSTDAVEGWHYGKVVVWHRAPAWAVWKTTGALELAQCKDGVTSHTSLEFLHICHLYQGRQMYKGMPTTAL